MEIPRETDRREEFCAPTKHGRNHSNTERQRLDTVKRVTCPLCHNADMHHAVYVTKGIPL